MKFLEKNLEDIIFETDSEILEKHGIKIYKNKKRQLRIGNYGIADLICWEFERTTDDLECSKKNLEDCEKLKCINCLNYKISNLKIQIIELKKNIINTDAFLQAIRYLKGISRYFEYRIKT